MPEFRDLLKSPEIRKLVDEHLLSRLSDPRIAPMPPHVPKTTPTPVQAFFDSADTMLIAYCAACDIVAVPMNRFRDKCPACKGHIDYRDGTALFFVRPDVPTGNVETLAFRVTVKWDLRDRLRFLFGMVAQVNVNAKIRLRDDSLEGVTAREAQRRMSLHAADGVQKGATPRAEQPLTVLSTDTHAYVDYTLAGAKRWWQFWRPDAATFMRVDDLDYPIPRPVLTWRGRVVRFVRDILQDVRKALTWGTPRPEMTYGVWMLPHREPGGACSVCDAGPTELCRSERHHLPPYAAPCGPQDGE